MSSRRFLFRSGIGLSMLAFAFLPGCGIQGRWALSKVDPEAARRDFRYASMTFQHDGSFYAETQDHGVHTTSGVYKFGDNLLTLTENNGDVHTYDARLSGDQLTVEQVWKDRKIKARFVRH